MAKEVAIGKKAKISEAQQYMLLAVFGASLVFGAALCLTIRFIQQISFNTDVIATEEQSIAAYSDIIKTTGVCKSPSGSVYSDSELNACDPNAIDAEDVPGTLRANILQDLAANKALGSVPKEASSSCVNPSTGKNFTYKELNKLYDDAGDSDELAYAIQLLKSCSALRIIPDALPAFENEEALLASLNKIFLLSGWQPESISPSGESSNNPSEESEEATGDDIYAMLVGFSVEAETPAAMNLLNNLERSIRQFDVQNAHISWENDDALNIEVQATAYYINKATIVENEKTITTGEQ